MQYSTNGPTILVGEDEPELRESVDAALKALGYSVELAQDGDEVLACLRSRSETAAVLLDTMLPNRGGLETLSEIHATYPTLPVIMISGWPSMQSAVTAMNGGAADFLSKPISQESLRNALTRVLDLPSASASAPVLTLSLIHI